VIIHRKEGGIRDRISFDWSAFTSIYFGILFVF
jgi:hypothetical protein